MKCRNKTLAYWIRSFAMLAIVLRPVQFLCAQTIGGGSILQERYGAAQRFQAANDLVHAAEQYRIFLADTLGELALGYARAGQYAKAKDDFDEALRLVPEFPMMRLEYARAALRAGDFEHAATLAKDLLEEDAKNTKVATGAHTVLGEALMKMEKNGEAKVQFEAAVYLDPSFENGYELAVADLNLGDIESARKVFAEMLASFGDTAALHMYFGEAYGNSDFQSDALAEFLKAREKDAHFKGVHYSLAVAYLATAGDSKLANAETELREEMAVSPNDAPAHAALGHLIASHAQDAKDLAEAEADLKRACELDPSNPDSFFYLGQLYSDQKRLAEAEAALRTSINLTRDASRNSFQVQKAHYVLGRVLSQRGSKAEADKEFAISQDLLKQNLTRDQGRLSRYLGERGQAGMVSEFVQPSPVSSEQPSGDLTSRDAVESFEARMKPAIADSYNNLGAIAANREDYGAAVICFQRAAEWEPNIPGLDFNWGRAAFAAAAYAQAIGPLSRYLQTHPQEDGARRVLGLSQFMVNDYSAARATLAELAGRPSESPKVKVAYAVSLLKTGDVSSAITLLRELQQANPGLPEIPRALDEANAALAGHR